MSILAYAGATEKRAIEEPFDSATFYVSRQADISRAAIGRPDGGPAESRQERAERLAALPNRNRGLAARA